MTGGARVAGQAGTRERATRPFQAVVDELSGSSEFRSAQEIHAALRTAGTGVGMATVYRALQSLVDAGSADVVKTDSGESVYRACSQGHHHHLVCRWCGHTVEVQGPAVERWADAMAAHHGFSDVSHTIELFGTCADCAERRS
ncbi:MAG: Fur family transcriptional regulator [Nocardioides sp.]|uniref:Fur family transcriptional regulator n=1 Tax=Nocardioides sp. TaxID=35761 RepID=UPI0039E4F8DA